MDYSHLSVLPNEVLEYLVTPHGVRYVDGTLGGAGHASLLLEKFPRARLLGIDRDEAAIRAAEERLGQYGKRVRLCRGSYGDMKALVRSQNWDRVDGILLDLGISSHQIDTPDRGFSLRFDGPLDMRMDRRARVTASQLLNTAPEEELARIFYEYGEERRSRRIARAVVERRQEKLWERTGEFAEFIEKILGRPRKGLPPATRCFQALRIAVNDELGQLREGLAAAVELLRPGGRLVVISFHSLEDRMVKRFFRDEAKSCICPPEQLICNCGKQVRLKVLTRRPVEASVTELEQNRRAASAKLRAAERVGSDETPEAEGLGQDDF
jgi:16S rRNA (cytosine1402-N4)-methyltransferase